MKREIIFEQNKRYVIKEDDRLLRCTIKYRNTEFTGVSYCRNSDTFDIEKGKKLAKLRAILNIQHYKRDILIFNRDAIKTYLGDQDICNIASIISEKINYINSSIKRLKERINKLVIS